MNGICGQTQLRMYGSSLQNALLMNDSEGIRGFRNVLAITEEIEFNKL